MDDLRALVLVNIEGFLFISQLAVKQMLAPKTGVRIVNITSTIVDYPIAGVHAAVPMITKIRRLATSWTRLLFNNV